MPTNLMDIQVEDYSSRRRDEAPSPVTAGASGGVPVPALLVLSVLLTAFVVVAVALSQIAGAC